MNSKEDPPLKKGWDEGKKIIAQSRQRGKWEEKEYPVESCL